LQNKKVQNPIKQKDNPDLKTLNNTAKDLKPQTSQMADYENIMLN